MCRELERLHQVDHEHSLSSVAQRLKLHMDPFADVVQKLHVDD